MREPAGAGGRWPQYGPRRDGAPWRTARLQRARIQTRWRALHSHSPFVSPTTPHATRYGVRLRPTEMMLGLAAPSGSSFQSPYCRTIVKPL